MTIIAYWKKTRNFYSRPCGRGDASASSRSVMRRGISTHAPAGGATVAFAMARTVQSPFLLTPLREGRPRNSAEETEGKAYFYSRPCGRGDDRQHSNGA